MQSRLILGSSHSKQRRARSTIRPNRLSSTNGSQGYATPAPEDKSRKRTLSLLSDSTSPDDYLHQLNDQLISRDSHISHLNDQIIGLKAVMKLWETQSAAKLDRQLKAAYEEIDKIGKDKIRLETVAMNLEEKITIIEDKCEKEKENLEEKIKDLMGKVEKQRAELLEKGKIEAESKADLSKLNSILKEMSKMNSGFKEKIAGMNAEMESLSKSKYEIDLRLQSLLSIESEADRLRNEISTYETRLTNEPDAAAKLQSLENMCQNAYQKLVAIIGKLQENREIAGELRDVANIFGENTKIRRKITEMDWEEMQNRLKNAKKENEELNRENEKLKKIIEAQNERISFLEKNQVAKSEENKAESLFHTQKILEMEEIIASLQNENRECHFSESKLNDLIEKLKGENDNLQVKLGISRNQLQDARRQLESQKTTLKNIQLDLIQVKSSINTANTVKKTKERANAELEFKLEAIKEELWKKETELLRKESHRIRLEEEIRVLHSQNLQLVKAASSKQPIPTRKFEEVD